MTGKLSILICTRDNAATVERAVVSCLPETECPIVLIDDHCTDDTVARARSVAGRRLRVVAAPHPGGLPVARQCGLDVLDTEFGAWFDPDDEWVHGRAARLTSMLESGADVAVEAIDLHDGGSGEWLRRLTVPGFLRRPGGVVRLFERNFLPGDSQVGFRAGAFRDAGGYDPTISVQCFDLLLRALRIGARMAFGDEPGYRMYAYPNSLSRNLPRQRAALAATLAKHPEADVRRLYREAGYSPRIADWGLVLMAQYRNEPAAALGWLESASPPDADPCEILEPDGPWPFPEGWRRAFHRGTALLSLGESPAALDELSRAEAIAPTAEAANNLGVALARVGRMHEARDAWAAASARFPGYADARLNATAATPANITTHPLRRAASRSEY